MEGGVLKYRDLFYIVFFRVRTIRPKLGVFQIFQNTAFLLLYYSACKKGTTMVLIWGDRGYPAIRFEYKTTSEQYLVTELWAKEFWVFFEKSEILNFFKNTQNRFAYILSTKYCSEAVLYSKRTAGYPLSPPIKTIAVNFFYKLDFRG